MPKLEGVTADRMADEFVNYLFDRYRGTRHVRRVASWIGFIVAGIEQIRDSNDWDIPRERQLRFSAFGRRFTASYDHTVRPQGGIVIREILDGRGAPKGPALHSIANLEDAEAFYRQPRRFFTS